MHQMKKIEKIFDTAMTEDLSRHAELLKKMKKKLPFFAGNKRIAAALLREYLGDISNLDLDDLPDVAKRDMSGQVVFEDVKDGKARIFLNVGKNHRISPGDLIREIVKRSGIDGKLIGKIDIHTTYSFIEVPEQYAELVLLSMDDVKIKGIPVVAEPAKRRKAPSK